jgi:glutamyl-tRNA reductase
VHGLAVRLLRERFGEDGDRRPVAVVGTGEIGRRVRDLLEADPRFAPRALNRSIAEEDRGRVAPLSELPQVLAGVEAAVVCTSAPQPVIGSAQLAGHAEGRPLLLVDLGIPEQVARQGLPEGVERLGLDELTLLPESGASVAEEPDAEEMVERAVAELERFCREPVYAEIFDAVSRNHRRVVAGEIPRLLSSLPQLDPAERARLEAELGGIIGGYTNDLFRALREAAAPPVEKDGGPEAS